MTHPLYWFRQDLRLHDNPALQAACAGARQMTLVFCHDPRLRQTTPWGFERGSPHQQQFLHDTLAELAQRIEAAGNRLLQFEGLPGEILPVLARDMKVTAIHAECLPAPYELQDETAVRHLAGVPLHTHWQTTVFHPDDAPFAIDRLPRMYTYFKNALHEAGTPVRPPVASLASLPPPAPGAVPDLPPPTPWQAPPADARSSFPYHQASCRGGETAALTHLEQYVARQLPLSYEKTRNQLHGLDYSSKLSPWLATGALSVRTVERALRGLATEHGPSTGIDSLWSEVLWRDFFRYLHLKHGRKLYHASGIGHRPEPPHNPEAFERWCQGDTGQPLVDAGMRELRATGFLSNRLRQVVASYLINDLQCDWRAGAAWFEHCLVDFDVCSNQGNWLAAAGRGPDARGRRFNPEKQARDHDRSGDYRRLWAR